MAFELSTKQIEALAEDMAINKACGCHNIAAAEHHIPLEASDEFLRGMASGLMLAATMFGEDDPEMNDMLRCLAAQAAVVHMSVV